MGTKNLHASIGALRAEVAQLDDDDAVTRARLERLITDLEQQLERPEDVDHRDSMLATLTRLTERFEVEHPRITGVFNRLANALSNMGI